MRVNAWMLAKIIKSSSPLVSSRQLLRLARTVSSVNSAEHETPFPPSAHPQPSCKNLVHFSIILLLFSSELCSAIVKVIDCRFVMTSVARSTFVA